MDKKKWQGEAVALKELLNLEYSPVAVSIVREALKKTSGNKTRICKAILDAGKGEVIELGKANNACFGASLHLGFHGTKNSRLTQLMKKFVVEGEKLFCSYEALDNFLSQLPEVPDNSDAHFTLAPLEKASLLPQLVLFIVNPEAACRLLTLLTFIDGNMPKIKIGGPTCRMGIVLPLQTNEANLSFYDFTARTLCDLDKDKLLVTIPYSKIAALITSIDSCSAGKAKIEFLLKPRATLAQTHVSKE